jgi:signal transduction histidine kinase
VTTARGDRHDRSLHDAAVAAAVFAVVLGATLAASRHEHPHRAADAGTVVLVLLATAPLAVRRRHPVAALVVVYAAIHVYIDLGYAVSAIWLPLIVTYVGAVAAGHRVVGAVIAVTGIGVLPFLPHLTAGDAMPSLGEVAGVAAWVLVLFAIGEAIRTRRERSEEAARIREEEALRRASEERLRIARDLHDVLAHSISVINVQAGVALHLGDELPEQVQQSLTVIRQASRDALTEVRSALDVLRRSGEPAPRDPAPGLAQLDTMLDRARLGGLDVQLDVEGDKRVLPAAVDLAAYRILQESLTNVIRHANARTARVRITHGDRELRLRVDDDGRGAPALRIGDAHGSGITGMRERVAALDGELHTGPRPGGGFRVEARLPL